MDRAGHFPPPPVKLALSLPSSGATEFTPSHLSAKQGSEGEGAWPLGLSTAPCCRCPHGAEPLSLRGWRGDANLAGVVRLNSLMPVPGAEICQGLGWVNCCPEGLYSWWEHSPEELRSRVEGGSGNGSQCAREPEHCPLGAPLGSNGWEPFTPCTQ